MGDQSCNFSPRRKDLVQHLMGSLHREACTCCPLENCYEDSKLCGWDINNCLGCFRARKGSQRATRAPNGGSKYDANTPPQPPLYISGQLNPLQEKSYSFRHYSDTRRYMKDYRRNYVVEDEHLKRTTFGFDSERAGVPDPYEFKIYRYRELFQRLDTILQPNGPVKTDERKCYSSFVRPVVSRSHECPSIPPIFWTRILETLKTRTHVMPKSLGGEFLTKFRHSRPAKGQTKTKETTVEKSPTLAGSSPNHQVEYKELQLPIIQTSYGVMTSPEETANESTDERPCSSESSDSESLAPLLSERVERQRPMGVEGTEIRAAVRNGRSCLDLLYGPSVKFPFSVQIVHDGSGVHGSKRSYQPPLKRSSSVPIREMPPIEGVSSYRVKLSDAKTRKKPFKSSRHADTDKYVTAARENFEKAREKFFGSRPTSSSMKNRASVASVREWDLREGIREPPMPTDSTQNPPNSTNDFTETSDEKILKTKVAENVQNSSSIPSESIGINFDEHEIRGIAIHERRTEVNPKDNPDSVRWKSSVLHQKPNISEGGPKKRGKQQLEMTVNEYRNRFSLKEEEKQLQEKLRASLRLSPMNHSVSGVNENKEQPKKQQAPSKSSTVRQGPIKLRIMELSDARIRDKDVETKLGIKGKATGPETKSNPVLYREKTDSSGSQQSEPSTPRRGKLVEVPKFLPTHIKMTEMNTVIVEGNPYVTEDQHKAFVGSNKTRTA
uniref:Uncharacterized protein LOC100371725 n=1 Tax=Saccoglossus kowalevskii TaxID=10224 RepID=A0ABM0GRW6_SACKO|nr:PREDICTED: uncharacterized protein LOC100371725 [Saccoglossus kowalevskii]